MKHPGLYPYVPRGTLAMQRWHGLLWPTVDGFTNTSGTAYWNYMGQVVEPFIPKYVAFSVSSAGSGAQTAEVALAYSQAPPNKAAQTLTHLASTGTITSLTGTGLKRNTAAFTVKVPAGMHLWAGVRTAMASTQPTITGYLRDFERGISLTTAGASALTGGGPWTGSIIAWSSATPENPALWLEED